MAYTVANRVNSGLRKSRLVTATITISGSYTQGTGELVLAADFGLSQIHNILCGGAQTTFGGYVPLAVPVTPVGADCSSFNLLFLYGDNNNASDGPLIEIPTAAYPAGLSGATYWLTLHGRL